MVDSGRDAYYREASVAELRKKTDEVGWPIDAILQYSSREKHENGGVEFGAPAATTQLGRCANDVQGDSENGTAEEDDKFEEGVEGVEVALTTMTVEMIQPIVYVPDQTSFHGNHVRRSLGQTVVVQQDSDTDAVPVSPLRDAARILPSQNEC